MSATSRRPMSALQPETVLAFAAIGVAAGVAVIITAAVQVGAWLQGSEQRPPVHPVQVVTGLLDGTVVWTSETSWGLAGVMLVLAAVGSPAVWVVQRARRHATRVDRAARKMGRGRDLGDLTAKGAGAIAARLGVKEAPGLPIARTVAGGAELYQDWESVAIDIAGPRMGKTSSRVAPMILAAPGAVLATSNKRDLVDCTRDIRAKDGKVWVFDPQSIADEQPTWWWNPMTYVTDEVKAQKLTSGFVSATRRSDARTDAFFDPAARGLFSNLLLAAATEGRQISQVYLWTTEPTEDEPVQILRDHDYPLAAAAVAGHINSPDKQRAGVYGTAQQMAEFLTNRQALRWVTDGGRRPQFDPHAFVAGTDTLYSLSLEDEGSAAPLVTGLTIAVLDAAEERAKRSPGGRLQVPLVAVLDEAANVVRWSSLPNLYSHYGSRGICVSSFLQSWSQGVAAWGQEGMRKLWSAANIRVYGGGVAEPEFLEQLSKLIGNYDSHHRSISYGREHRSSTHDLRSEPIMEVSDLGSLPKGRMVVFASGTRPVLARAMPWMTGPHAEQIKASIRAHDPGAEGTIEHAANDLVEIFGLEPASTARR